MKHITQKDQKVIEKPWGKEIVWCENKNYAGKILIINKGCRLSLQYHEKKVETILVLSGILTVEKDDAPDAITVQSGEALHVPVGSVHRFCAKDSTVTLIEVSTPDLDDVVRLADDYGR